jgi:hypothetical protein
VTEAAGSGAILTRSTEPAPATLDPATPAEVKAADEKPLGTLTVRLLDLRAGAVQSGQRVEARGFLIRKGDEVSVNVASSRTIAPNCP